MITELLERVRKEYSLSEINVGEYQHINKKGLHFDIHSYDADEIGCVSTINMKAMFGLMKMESFIIVSLDKDVPLFSFDLIKAFGKEVIIIDIYDLCIEKGRDYSSLAALKEKYAQVKDYDLKSGWYDYLRINGVIGKEGRGKKTSLLIDSIVDDYMNEIMQILKNGTSCERESKREHVKEYVNGLFENGSPTVEQFDKILGREKAVDMYTKYIFFSQKIDG